MAMLKPLNMHHLQRTMNSARTYKMGSQVDFQMTWKAHRLYVPMQDERNASHGQTQAAHLLACFMNDAFAFHALNGIDFDTDRPWNAWFDNCMHERPARALSDAQSTSWCKSAWGYPSVACRISVDRHVGARVKQATTVRYGRQSMCFGKRQQIAVPVLCSPWGRAPLLQTCTLFAPAQAAADVNQEAWPIKFAVFRHSGVHFRHATGRDWAIEAFKSTSSTKGHLHSAPACLRHAILRAQKLRQYRDAPF
jgi:hypothetical protein